LGTRVARDLRARGELAIATAIDVRSQRARRPEVDGYHLSTHFPRESVLSSGDLDSLPSSGLRLITGNTPVAKWCLILLSIFSCNFRVIFMLTTSFD
jgi:hypothetical protein